MKEEDIKLGFGDPPVPTYIFVGESGNPKAPWYELDFKEDKKIPIEFTALTGKLIGLKMVKKVYKKKESVKLDISFQAEKRYVIRSGVDTSFSRGFLLAAQQMDMLDELITLVAIQGDDSNVVFCKIYYAINEEAIKAEWNPDIKLLPIINNLQIRFGQHPQTYQEVMSGQEHKENEPETPQTQAPIPAAEPESPVEQEPPPEPPIEPEVETVDDKALAKAKAVKPPEEKVQVPATSRVPAPLAVSKRTMGAEYYATEIDDVITVKQLGTLRTLAEQLKTTDKDFCVEVMGCEPSDLSIKGADHLIHFAEVKVKGDDKAKK